MERQPRLTDLIPQSIAGLAAWFAVGALLIGGLEALYFIMPRLAVHSTDGRIAAFDLDGEGSLSVWFSSTTLAAAAVVALIVYSLRKHRADDYHAKYRIWIAAAVCWFGMSIDESASLHEGFKEIMTGLTGERGFGDGAIWWVGAYALVLGVVGIKLVLDMRECLASTALLLLAGAAYAAAVAVQLNWILPDSGARGVMLEEGLEMGGNLVLLLSMMTHARYVILEIEGVVKPKKKKDKDKSSDKSKTADGPEPVKTGWFRRAKIDPPHSVPAPAGRTSDLEPAGKSAKVGTSGFRATAETTDAAAGYGSSNVKKVTGRFDDEEDDDDERRDNRKPSKADRKAMRKAKESQRRGYDDE